MFSILKLATTTTTFLTLSVCFWMLAFTVTRIAMPSATHDTFYLGGDTFYETEEPNTQNNSLVESTSQQTHGKLQTLYEGFKSLLGNSRQLISASVIAFPAAFILRSSYIGKVLARFLFLSYLVGSFVCCIYLISVAKCSNLYYHGHAIMPVFTKLPVDFGYDLSIPVTQYITRIALEDNVSFMEALIIFTNVIIYSDFIALTITMFYACFPSSKTKQEPLFLVLILEFILNVVILSKLGTLSMEGKMVVVIDAIVHLIATNISLIFRIFCRNNTRVLVLGCYLIRIAEVFALKLV